MTLTELEATYLAGCASGVLLVLALTGLASWVVMWRSEWRRGTVLEGEELERAKRREQ